MRELNQIEEKILDKALRLVGENGHFDLTIRSLAKEANVNISAINYYFESKENMLNLLKEFYIENVKDSYSQLESDKSPIDKIKAFAYEVMEYSIKYPGIIIIVEEASNYPDDKGFKKIIDETLKFQTLLDSVLKEIVAEDEGSIEFKKTIFLSSILHPTNYQNSISSRKFDVITPENRIKYIDQLVDLIF